MGSDLFPLRSLPWQSGLTDGPSTAVLDDLPVFDLPGFDTEDYEEIRIMLGACAR